jgi:DNA-binding GntR family transcriptional regulator
MAYLDDLVPADALLRVGRVAAPLREQVVGVLREAILDFRLKPGQRLIERELIEQIGVSRTTIREVLRQLATEGLVTTIPQKGAIVVIPSPEEAIELFEVRAVLEAAAVRRFAQRAAPDQVRSLRAAMEQMQRVVARGPRDVREVLDAKDAFYDVLLAGARNGALQTMLSGLRARMRVLRASSLSQPGRQLVVADELRRIVEAIEAGDADRAAAICTQHLEDAARTGLDAISAANPGGE